jgi:hypothetical protein
MVRLFAEVERPHERDRMIEVGMASPATIVLRQSRMNRSTVKATAPPRATVLPHGGDGALMARLVHHLQVDVRGQDGAELVELRLHAVDHLHRVGAGLLADDELDRVLAVQPGEAARLDDAVLGIAEVTHVKRPPAHVRHDEFVEIAHRLDASHRAHGQLAARLIEPPAGQLDVLTGDGIPHLADRQPLGRDPPREPDHRQRDRKRHRLHGSTSVRTG